MKSNAVAYTPYIHTGKKKKGQPRTYDDKIALKSLYDDESAMAEIPSPVYAEKDVTIRYAIHDLRWHSAGRMVRFVIVIHPARDRCILMSTDITLSAIDIIYIYGLRFKIERKGLDVKRTGHLKRTGHPQV